MKNSFNTASQILTWGIVGKEKPRVWGSLILIEADVLCGVGRGWGEHHCNGTQGLWGQHYDGRVTLIKTILIQIWGETRPYWPLTPCNSGVCLSGSCACVWSRFFTGTYHNNGHVQTLHSGKNIRIDININSMPSVCEFYRKNNDMNIFKGHEY